VLNANGVLFAGLAASFVWLMRQHRPDVDGSGMDHSMEGNSRLKRYVALLAAAILAGGLVAFTVTGGPAH
jgi:H+/Cl- antiporter ClcA